MTGKVLILLFLVVAAQAMPNLKKIKEELQAAKVSSLLMPGPILLHDKKAVGSVDVSAKCEFCELVMTELDKMLTDNSTEEEIKTDLELVCARMPSAFSAECKLFIDMYAPQILAVLAQELNPAIVCKELKLCSAAAILEVNDIKVSAQCEICEAVAKEIDDLISQNSTQQEIVDALEEVCQLFPQKAKECEAFLKEYIPEILNLIAMEVSPDVLCKELGLCASSVQFVRLEGPKSNFAPAEDIEVNDFKVSPQCEVCEAVSKEIHDLISLNSTQQEIVEALEKTCKYCPVQKECEAFLKEYIPEILNMIAMEISPDKFCKELGLCSSSLKLIGKEELTKQDVMMDVDGPKNANLTCGFCEKIMEYAKELAAKNDTRESIEKLLTLVCYYMPFEFKECKKFIDDTIPMIFKDLAKMDPKQICQQIGLCPKGAEVNDVRCFMSDVNHCSNPELAEKCNAVEFCRLIKMAGRHLP